VLRSSVRGEGDDDLGICAVARDKVQVSYKDGETPLMHTGTHYYAVDEHVVMR
jgi:hypothetical protein